MTSQIHCLFGTFRRKINAVAALPAALVLVVALAPQSALALDTSTASRAAAATVLMVAGLDTLNCGQTEPDESGANSNTSSTPSPTERTSVSPSSAPCGPILGSPVTSLRS